MLINVFSSGHLKKFLKKTTKHVEYILYSDTAFEQ